MGLNIGSGRHAAGHQATAVKADGSANQTGEVGAGSTQGTRAAPQRLGVATEPDRFEDVTPQNTAGSQQHLGAAKGGADASASARRGGSNGGPKKDDSGG